MIATVASLELSRAHQAVLAQVAQAEAEEAERAEQAAEAWAWRCAMSAPLIREIYDEQRAAADQQAARAEQAAQQERDETIARARDNAALLIGAGRVPRTVREILGAAALFT